jgi:signal peptidase II
LQRWGLILMAALIACLFAAWLWRTQRKVACAGLALIVGGAVGNLIDRARYGAVVDFLDFSALHFPWIFNVADAAITVGAALLALDFLLEAREDRARKAGETSGAPSVDPNEERA